MHRHKCSLCGTIWEHGSEWDNNMHAHECGTCGSHQFRAIIERGPQAGPAQSAKPALGEALNSPEAFVRSTTVFALDMQSVEARAAMPRLLEMLSGDPEPMVRLAVVEALRRCGPDASGVVPAFAAALLDSYAEVRRAAAFALGGLGPAASVAQAALTRSQSDVNPRVRVAAAKALQSIQSNDGARDGTNRSVANA